ncbi:uncharacterized protein BO72DRAFT_481750 [Aspergillus fijiensis CBS 313.89]|uniref:PRELI/MSF1 domain-containing protein n=1 Tax=Aspergillus fijiensis CBS 313.89 TaxID=1448319 RepID=A0A8G1RGK0_9EURO|nr:uncharacterized protein BO72DRAFT_481750 [Aspergillus fijiensis CBS 313.89]RAK71410.1 hypothetical protein BO72DRAFT_481750 [Aspergillus fijiensis CBS 313.89]
MQSMASASLEEDFQIISSLRYDPALRSLSTEKAADKHFHPSSTPYYLLPYHQARLRNAAECFGWKKALSFLQKDLTQLSEYLDAHILDKTRPWRIRIIIERTGACTVEVNPTASIDPLNMLIPNREHTQSNLWNIYVDTGYITPSAFTRHKTTARDFYNAARVRAGIMSPLDQAEVLLVNPEGQVMEGSITTPYFRRRRPVSKGESLESDTEPDWVTPPLSSGGNAGTTRQYALAEGFCAEQIIEVADLIDGEVCWLSNGVRGFIRGRIVLNRLDDGQGVSPTTTTPPPAQLPQFTIPYIHPIPSVELIISSLRSNSHLNQFNVSTYDYSFPAVSLAYFLRYPNPYSRHVLTTDVIDRYVDPDTKRLHTIRLHLKKSKVPSGILKLLPKGMGGSDSSGQSYILETTIVDVNEGWMRTESRNMEWTGILSVVEKQFYQRQPLEGALDRLQGLHLDAKLSEQTTVKTTVTFHSRFGQGKLLGRRKAEAGDQVVEVEDEAPKRGFFTSLSTAGIQRTIELIGLNRTRDAILKSKQGMNVVLERLRSGGIVGVLEGMRQDREAIVGPEGPWKRVWLRGNGEDDEH